jgi:hypothetical protein
MRDERRPPSYLVRVSWSITSEDASVERAECRNIQRSAADGRGTLEKERYPHPELAKLRLSEELRRKLVQHMIASAGVLVPAALTAAAAVRIGADAAGNVRTDRAEIGLCVRQNVERIAKCEG